MKKTVFPLIIGFALLLTACSKPIKNETITLKNAFNGKFLVGAAMNEEQINGTDTASVALIKNQFNSIVAENCMKIENLQPQQGVFDFALADKFVEFGEQNDMFIVGHTLVWHSQVPAWLFIDKNGNEVSRDTLIERMRKHITTVVGHYKCRVDGWDVINEGIDDVSGLRKSKWLQIIGEDYIELAFQFAHEADPDAQLYYNDYSMFQPNKREETVKLVKKLQEKDIRIDAVGMQAHYGLGYPDLDEMEKSIVAFSALGVKVMFTEFDISVLPYPDRNTSAEISRNYKLKAEYNPYPNSLPDSVQDALTKHYTNIFSVLLKHSESMSRVTFWGVNDKQSWRNNWPVAGRTDYPLLFDRNNQPKPAYFEIIKLAETTH